MILGMAIRCIVRVVAAAVAVLGLAVAAGCSSEQGQVLVSSESDEYSDPVWVGDSVYYFAQDQDDSDTRPWLMRVRAGGRPEPVKVEHPDCLDASGVSPSPSAIVTISDHELGLVMSCGPLAGSVTAPSVFVRWDVDSGQTATVAKIDYSHGGVAWSAGTGTVYFPAYSCPPHKLSAVGGRPSICFGGPDAVFPALTADGSVIYFTSRCGTDAAEPASTYSICRHDSEGRASTLARGVRGPTALTVHGDRIVFAGQMHGDYGVWLITAGNLERLAEGYHRGVAFNADGTRLAVTVEDKGWLSTTWSLRVIAVPPL
jgi:hypothetical protein